MGDSPAKCTRDRALCMHKSWEKRKQQRMQGILLDWLAPYLPRVQAASARPITDGAKPNRPCATRPDKLTRKAQRPGPRAERHLFFSRARHIRTPTTPAPSLPTRRRLPARRPPPTRSRAAPPSRRMTEDAPYTSDALAAALAAARRAVRTVRAPIVNPYSSDAVAAALRAAAAAVRDPPLSHIYPSYAVEAAFRARHVLFRRAYDNPRIRRRNPAPRPPSQAQIYEILNGEIVVRAGSPAADATGGIRLACNSAPSSSRAQAPTESIRPRYVANSEEAVVEPVNKEDQVLEDAVVDQEDKGLEEALEETVNNEDQVLEDAVVDQEDKGLEEALEETVNNEDQVL